MSLSPLRERLLAVLCDGRGSDGALGALALARSIPAGSFVRSLRAGGREGARALLDPSYKPAAFDRAVSIDWLSSTDALDASNELDALAQRDVRVRLSTGYLQGTAHERYLRLLVGETAAEAAARADERAVEDAEQQRLALCCGPLVAGAGLTIDVVLVTRDGESLVSEIGDGRLICATTYRLSLSIPAA